MAGLFLDGPFFISSRNQQFTRLTVEHLFEAGGSSTQPDTEIGKEIGGKGKLEFAFEPEAGFGHEEIIAELEERALKRDAGHTLEARDKLV